MFLKSLLIAASLAAVSPSTTTPVQPSIPQTTIDDLAAISDRADMLTAKCPAGQDCGLSLTCHVSRKSDKSGNEEGKIFLTLDGKKGAHGFNVGNTFSPVLAFYLTMDHPESLTQMRLIAPSVLQRELVTDDSMATFVIDVELARACLANAPVKYDFSPEPKTDAQDSAPADGKGI